MESHDQSAISPAALAHCLELFFAEHPRAALLEDGRVLFELPEAHYSISSEHGRCVLHLWSEERNMVRTVVGLEPRQQTMRLRVRRLGTQRPQSLEIIRERDQRTPATRALARKRYLHLLERLVQRHFQEFQLAGLRSAMDLEHSFGPAYARGLLGRGQQCWAVIGINGEEHQATIDGVLTLGVLWLEHCRKQTAGKKVCQGLKLFVPLGTGATTRARMAWLDRDLAQWELYEVDAQAEELIAVDTHDQGNLRMRFAQAFQPQAAIERASDGVARIMSLIPEHVRASVTVTARSTNEVALTLYGLEFARVRQAYLPGSFALQGQISFGAGANETLLQPENEDAFTALMERVAQSRHPAGGTRDPLFRMQPEAWLQSALARDLTRLDERLSGGFVYEQVPAFAAADRAVLDLLTVTRQGRLAVLELKADEDLHFPLQALDYWIRVHWLQQQRDAAGLGELERNGYFPGRPLVAQSPLLLLVAPALRLHPSIEVVLRHLSPAIQWEVIALNEAWREEIKVIFRKRAKGVLT